MMTDILVVPTDALTVIDNLFIVTDTLTATDIPTVTTRDIPMTADLLLIMPARSEMKLN